MKHNLTAPWDGYLASKRRYVSILDQLFNPALALAFLGDAEQEHIEAINEYHTHEAARKRRFSGEERTQYLKTLGITKEEPNDH